MMILAAIERMAVMDGETLLIGRQALREALYATRDFEGLTGNLTCTHQGDCAKPRVLLSEIVSADPDSWDPGSNPVKVWP
jgi:branched-chain amino acid transport system substrate-binding protein